MENLLKRFFLLLATSFLWIGCEEENMLKPLEDNPVPPGTVSNITVKNKRGGAVLTYTLPSDQDLAYVKAEYRLPNGDNRTIKASFYTNQLTVDGFSQEGEYSVKLYAVNRSEVSSEPVEVTVHPEESPIWNIFRTLDVRAAFGGIQVTANNEDRADVAILIMEKNEYGEWIADPNSIYTSTDQIKGVMRGLDADEREFAFVVRDRWLNYTDTLYAAITPLYEEAIPNSGYRGYRLPGDAPNHTSTSHAGMWDGDIMGWPRIYMTQAAYSGPHMTTVDLGVTAKLSRLVIWDYPEYFNGRTYYYKGNLKEFEIWGSDNPPSDGSMNNWHLLGKYSATKPSGLPFGQQNDEDYQTAEQGFSWEFDLEAPKVRYLRIVSTKNWDGSTYMAIGEIQAYGDAR
ncbi:DUF5000 domain-containing lipoprotein [Sphingobacterium sp. FBM7-1]|uniref:DUF5000 domain-containing lipoprotein n=1 Tax=Sphingobacterium sp. FBM7-1 TaxID=2886688 RepID=UPI001D0FF5AF|nr:DUF5000 domain-containing lipoprotein [Sphingobacterium sp. FBM7-1]MCC2598479.1 DUF4959 domain-containing protein [Sphingobacterium sp. FBM7-1]